MRTAKPTQRKRSVSVTLDDEVTERLISREVVARRLDCDPSTIRRMVKAGRFIPPMLVGNLLRWRERDVNAWIVARAAAAKKIEAAATKSLEPQKRSRRG
jgi:predicted DNA-binding transcriptional regulator AlpA